MHIVYILIYIIYLDLIVYFLGKTNLKLTTFICLANVVLNTTTYVEVFHVQSYDEEDRQDSCDVT